MKVLAINGSPRKKWNTSTLLQKSLEGAKTRGAETELLHMYDIEFKGCISCFLCKTIDGPSYGQCIVKDGLTPILQKIKKTDVLYSRLPDLFRYGHWGNEIFHGAIILPVYDLHRSSRINLSEKDQNRVHIYLRRR